MNVYEYPALAEKMYRERLPNGLTVAVVPRKGFQKKLAYFVTDYGSIHRDFTLNGEACTSPAGVAHYLEHKMFDMPRGEISGEFADLGANPNAFTSYDITAYYFSCTEHFEKSLALLLEFVSTPYFTAESVAKEQGIIGQEIDMVADNPDTRVFENLMKAMYQSHGIRTPILGSKASISQITPQTLELCHRAFYSPANMILCVVGDVDPDRVRQMAASLPAREDRVEKAPMAKEPVTQVTPFVHDEMEIAMPMFQLGFKCEPVENGPEAMRREAIGDLAAEALFGESSQLYLELYGKGLIDSSFGGGFETVDGMAMLTISGDSDDPEAVRQAILDRAAVLAKDGVPEKEFLRMKRSALGRRIKELDSFDSVCFRICAYHFAEFDYFDFPAVYQQIQAGDLREFLARVVTEDRCSLSVITPITKEVS